MNMIVYTLSNFLEVKNSLEPANIHVKIFIVTKFEVEEMLQYLLHYPELCVPLSVFSFHPKIPPLYCFTFYLFSLYICQQMITSHSLRINTKRLLLN